MRNLSSRKDKALRRAATLLEDYKYSLREAYFVSEKRTIPVMGYENGDELHNMTPTMEAIIMKRKKPTIIGTDVVEIIAQNEGMKNALKRLNDVLTPFMDKSNSKVSKRTAATTKCLFVLSASFLYSLRVYSCISHSILSVCSYI